MGSNEFIKLGMHEAASEAASERGSEALRLPSPANGKSAHYRGEARTQPR